MSRFLGGLDRSVRTFRATVRNAALRDVTLAFFVFNAVELGAWTGILVFAYAATGPASVGLVAVLQLVPAALLAPIVAGIGDRVPRRRALVGGYLVQAAAMAALGAAVISGLPVAAVYGMAIIATVTMTITRPVHAALLPSLADDPRELTAANGLGSIAEGIGAFAGPLAVGLILSVANVGVAFIVGAVALLSAGLLAAGARPRGQGSLVATELRPGDPDEAGPAGDGDEGPPVPRVSGLGAVLRTVARDRDLLAVMALMTGRLVIYGGLEVVLVLVSIELLGTGEGGAGFLMAALGIGTIAGGAATFSLVGRRSLAPWLGVGAVVVGLQLALIGISPAPRSAAALLVIGGVGLALLDVVGQTLLQRIAPDEVRASVFGLLEAVLLLGEALGSLIIAPVALVLGLQGAMVALGLVLPVIALLALPRFGAIDARVVVPVERIGALRRLALFAPLPAPALEAVAGHLVPVRIPAGSVVVREGDTGDRYYVIASGRASVVVGEEARPGMGPGDGFGEIALLRDVSRTATVAAETDLELLALDREAFLAAVTNDPAALREAHRLAEARMRSGGVAATS
jgi:MFS family permease